MEEQLSSLAVTHLLQHTLRSLCIHDNSQWVYAVFWRILPRNFPPPKWDSQGGAFDRTRGNRRNWILVWEDGFCNFAASTTSTSTEIPSADYPRPPPPPELQHFHHQAAGLQPELFFKMSHEIYNYGEGIIGKVAADHSHKWVHREPNEQEINFLSAWHNSADSHPRTWEAQFQSGIKTIALVAVREGVIQLGAMNKVTEDLSYVVLVRKKLSLIESIPGVLLPHPSCSAFPVGYKADHHQGYFLPDQIWHYQGAGVNNNNMAPPPPLPLAPTLEYGGVGIDPFSIAHHHHQPLMMKITPSMSSLEALLSKLPSVVPPPPPTPTTTMTMTNQQGGHPAYQDPQHQQQQILAMLSNRTSLELSSGGGLVGVDVKDIGGNAKEQEVENRAEEEEEQEQEEEDEDVGNLRSNNVQERGEIMGECSSSMSSFHNNHHPHHHHHHNQNQQHFYYHHQDLNIAITRPENGF